MAMRIQNLSADALMKTFRNLGADIQEAIGVELYIPDCTIIERIQELDPPGEWMKYHLQVHHTEYQEIFDAYNDLLADKYDEEYTDLRAESEYANFCDFT